MLSLVKIFNKIGNVITLKTKPNATELAAKFESSFAFITITQTIVAVGIDDSKTAISVDLSNAAPNGLLPS